MQKYGTQEFSPIKQSASLAPLKLPSGVFNYADGGERLITPHDEATGLPYCFAPNPDLPAVQVSGVPNIERLADWNHMMPKYEVRTFGNEALGDIGKMALEGARVQWVDYNDHHYKYNFWFDGPEQPQDKEQLFQYLVMAEAGYVPAGAIDMSGNEPEVVELSVEERRALWESGQVRVYDKSIVRKFLFDYVFEQDLEHFSNKDLRKLREFLRTFDYERRIYLGCSLAARMIERAIDPVGGVYSTARAEESLPSYLPNNPRDLVKQSLLAPNKVGTVISEMSKKGGAFYRQAELVA
jgi:hypothetical protein